MIPTYRSCKKTLEKRLLMMNSNLKLSLLTKPVSPSQNLTQPMTMNPSTVIFSAFALATTSVSGSKLGDGAGYEFQSSRSSANAYPATTELENASSSLVIREKESYRDESVPELEATPMDQLDRNLVKCNGDERIFKLDMSTDRYGFETSWKLEALESGKWKHIESGPPDGMHYASNTRYLGMYCLSPGDYKFTIFDSFNDGICCKFGEGAYSGFVDSSKIFSSPNTDSEWAKRSHRFTISPPPSPPPTKKPTRKPTRRPTRMPTQRPTNIPRSNNVSCKSSEQRVKVETLTDRYGGDTSWIVRDSRENTLAKSNRKYGSNEKDVTEFCLEEGALYDFILYDEFGDGMCCQYGKGYYKVYLKEQNSWREIISGGTFKKKEVTHVINLTGQIMSQRDADWLDSHNSRRREWHERYNKTFVPLKWSNRLKADSKVWAIELLKSCGNGLFHDPNTHYGENVAGNSGKGSWATVRSTDAILTRFVENEVDKEYPKNSHLTQVLWRASKYVGCAEASKPKDGGGMCHVQVCRYARPGNCNMNKYMSADADWWIKPVMMDESPCGSSCPPEGCY